MKTTDPGHQYILETLDDGGNFSALTFVKREGPKYPGNVGHYGGTNLQEIWRASIARLRYLDAQDNCSENFIIIRSLQEAIYLLEIRAARRHGVTFPVLKIAVMMESNEIEDIPFCKDCGHILCKGH